MRSKFFLLCLLSLVAGEQTNLTLNLASLAGNGTCSSEPVVSFDYTVTSNPSPASAVLVCNRRAFDELLNANLSDPKSASLSPVLAQFSCINQNSTVCKQSFPSSFKLLPQIMCLLVKNWGPDNITAKVDVKWITESALNESIAAANLSANSTSNNTATSPASHPESPFMALVGSAIAILPFVWN